MPSLVAQDREFEHRYAHLRAAFSEPPCAPPPPAPPAPVHSAGGWSANEHLFPYSPIQTRRAVPRPPRKLILDQPIVVCTVEDFLSVAPHGAEAATSHPHPFRVPNADVPPLWVATTLFGRLPSPLIAHSPAIFPVGRGWVRSGCLDFPPPAIRMCAPWQALALLKCPAQIGHPPAMNADAPLGFPATVYRSAEITFDNCAAPRRILLMLGGNVGNRWPHCVGAAIPFSARQSWLLPLLVHCHPRRISGSLRPG